jgi:uncharacterized protein (UPF0333 family)
MYLTTIQIDGQTKSNSTATCNANIARQPKKQSQVFKMNRVGTGRTQARGHHKLAGTFF